MRATILQFALLVLILTTSAFAQEKPKKPGGTGPGNSAVGGGTSSAGTKLTGDELNRGPADVHREADRTADQSSPKPKEVAQVCVGFVTQKIKGDGKTTEDGLLCNVLDVTGAKDRAVVFLIGYPKYADVVDGDRINVYGVPVGTLSYQTVAGSTATVRKLTYSRGM